MAYIIVFFICGILLFSKHNIFYIFFSMCAFLKKAHSFLRLAPRLRARPAPCVFDNIRLKLGS
ncbi:hypothetical protein Hanom_Chr08g00701901 [Helianthus anomalus]